MPRTYLVQESQMITPTTLLLTLQRDEQERPLSFQPGQYAAISFEHGRAKSAARCFSIVSSPTDQDILQFSMRVRGRFTTTLSKLGKGDLVDVSGPYGGFVFDVTHDKKAVLMAGGIGITPFISIMRHLAKLNADNEVVLLYSSQTQDDLPFKDELLEMAKVHRNLKVVFVIGKGPTDKLPSGHAATGFITPELLDQVTAGQYGGQKFFICGPPVFMKAMSGLIEKKGVSKDKIMTEAFTQSSPKQTSILRSWPANAYALGIIGVFFGSFVVMINDLLKSLPPVTSDKPTKTSPYYLTNSRQKTLDQLVNTIPPSPDVITSPTANQTTQPTTQVINTPPPTYSPIYQAPAPQTTASTPPP